MLGFVAGKLLPRLRRRLSARTLLAASTAVVLAAFVLFAVARTHLAEPAIAMSILGFGVGAFSAAMPAVILAVTPKAETASAMSVNQVVRSGGFSIGSALSGLILAGYTTEFLPREVRLQHRCVDRRRHNSRHPAHHRRHPPIIEPAELQLNRPVVAVTPFA